LEGRRQQRWLNCRAGSSLAAQQPIQALICRLQLDGGTYDFRHRSCVGEASGGAWWWDGRVGVVSREPRRRFFRWKIRLSIWPFDIRSTPSQESAASLGDLRPSCSLTPHCGALIILNNLELLNSSYRYVQRLPGQP